MPSPTTTNLPRPKSWDEFENIMADLLKKIWKDPYVTRNGRLGQKQQGVDIFGQPEHLGGRAAEKYAGAQCKLTDELNLAIVKADVEQAKAFRPPLSEYMVATTAPRDAKLQEQTRNEKWPFPLVLWFWEDICLELSGHDDILQKHFPGWMKKTTSQEQVKQLLLSSQPEEFHYSDDTGRYLHTGDVNLHIVVDRSQNSDETFFEPWIKRFHDEFARRQEVYVYYGLSRVLMFNCVSVDGGRHIIPFPQSSVDLRISALQYHLGKIVNHPFRGYDFDDALSTAGFTVDDSLST
jgi:hypothetical protein